MRHVSALALVWSTAIALAGCGGEIDSRVSIPTPATATVTATRPTSTPALTATITSTPTITPTPTLTDTASPLPTPTPTSTATFTATSTLTPTLSWTATETYTPSVTATATASPSPSHTATASHTPTRTDTPSITETPTITATPSVTPTPTETPSTVCGNGFIESGETCESCPEDCTIHACDAASPVQVFRVDYAPPEGQSASSITVLVGYRSDLVSLPGNGSAVSSRVKNRPSNSIVAVNDLDYALRVVITRQGTLNPGRVFTVDFDPCQGARTAVPADFGCAVEGCASSFGPIDGCRCAVSLP